MEKWIIALFLGTGSVMDVRKREIPVLLPGVFGVTGLVLQIGRMAAGEGWTGHGFLAGNAWIAGGLAGILLTFVGKITHEAIGCGDGLSAVVLGIWLGLVPMMEILFLGLVLSAVYSAWLLAVKHKSGKTQIPFLPFFLAGYLVWIFLGRAVAG